MLDKIKNLTLYRNKYRTHSEAVIIACYFNPQNSIYRRTAFKKWYESIKHLNHRIVECVIGDADVQLPESPYITRVYTDDLLWHKESLLNKLVKELPVEFKYVFWLDTDVIFTNLNWLVESVDALKHAYKVLQPFEYCVHLEKDELVPSFDYKYYKPHHYKLDRRHPKMWRSFGANHATTSLSSNENYDLHGHVGFAWGARREVLDAMPLFDKALIGGADHIIAHAAAGHNPLYGAKCHKCIEKSFTDDIESIRDWSRKFHALVQGRVGYVKGDLFHIWHGDIEKRNYYGRIKDFTPKAKTITQKDKNGLYTTKDKKVHNYMNNYFYHREVDHDLGLEDALDNVLVVDSFNQIIDQPVQDTNNLEFGGGSGGGAGAGGSWEVGNLGNDVPETPSIEDTYIDSTNHNHSNETFS